MDYSILYQTIFSSFMIRETISLGALFIKHLLTSLKSLSVQIQGNISKSQSVTFSDGVLVFQH